MNTVTTTDASEYLRSFPLAIVFKGDGCHELEIQARSTDQAVDSDTIASLLDLRKEFINDLGDGFQGFRCGLVTLVLAAPFPADAVEAHGTIRQGYISQCSVGTSVLRNRSKGLSMRGKYVRIERLWGHVGRC
jgi:hypothetical protein